MIVEAFAGWWSNSLALLSDATHMLMDGASLGFSLLILWLSRQTASRKFSFGLQRVEVLGALASGLAVWAMVGFLIYEAVGRLTSPEEVRAPIVIATAAFGLAANLWSMRILHGESQHSLNVRAAYLHVIMDCIGSVGAIIAGVVLWIWGWTPIDPLVTLISCALILFGSWGLIRESVHILLEGVPSHIDLDVVESALRALPGVGAVHDLHIWTLSSGKSALSAHLVLDQGGGKGSQGSVMKGAHSLLESRFGIHHTTLQIEDPKENAELDCHDCGET